MTIHSAIGSIMDNANAINDLCDRHNADNGLRAQLHHLHGELISRGCTDPSEVMRVVAARLELESQQEIGA